MGIALPQAFTDKMQALLQDEYDDFIATYERPRQYGLRVNGLKLSRDAFVALSPFGERSKAVPWCEEALYYEENDRPGKHPHYHAGLYYIQEPSAMVPAELLGVRPGDRVLDLCAAPGGKSTQLAAKLQGTGVLVVNDNAKERTKALAKNIELAGVRNAIVLNEEPQALAGPFAGWFDRILVDAPCSGEGMFRKDESMIAEWERHSVDKCSMMQRNILRHAAAMLAAGGTLVYSTCTFSPEENEAQIAALLADYPELEVIPVRPKFGWAPGRPDWIVPAKSAGMPEDGDRMANGAEDARHRSGAKDGFEAGKPEVRHVASGTEYGRMTGEAEDGSMSGTLEDRHVASEAEDGRVAGKAEGAAVTGMPEDERLASIAGTVRLWPHRTGGEGHYAAVLRKRTSAGEGEAGRKRELDGELLRAAVMPESSGGGYAGNAEPAVSRSGSSPRKERLLRRAGNSFGEAGRNGGGEDRGRASQGGADRGRGGQSGVAHGGAGQRSHGLGSQGGADRGRGGQGGVGQDGAGQRSQGRGSQGGADRDGGQGGFGQGGAVQRSQGRRSEGGANQGRGGRGGAGQSGAGQSGAGQSRAGRGWAHQGRGEQGGARQGGAGMGRGSGIEGNDAVEAWRRFAADYLPGAVRWPGEPVAYGSRVYLQPAGLPSLAGLRVVRAGWFLGEAGAHRFVPSQALAMGLRRQEAALSLRLRADEEATLRYLKGETLHIEPSRLERGEAAQDRPEESALSGYVLVCADDFSIGWGKMGGDGLFKNELPAGWRLM